MLVAVGVVYFGLFCRYVSDLARCSQPEIIWIGENLIDFLLWRRENGNGNTRIQPCYICDLRPLSMSTITMLHQLG